MHHGNQILKNKDRFLVKYYNMPSSEEKKQSSKMDESLQTKQIRHMYDMAHATPTFPALNAIYTSKFQNHIHKKDILLPQQLEQGKFCEHCGVVFIPVINLQMRVIFGKSKKKLNGKVESIGKLKWKPRTRKLRYSCLICKSFTDYDLLIPTQDPKTKEKHTKPKDPFVATWPQDSNKNSIPKREASSAKERAKKRKKNNLSNLLNQKKEREDKEKKIGSILSLEEFMKG